LAQSPMKYSISSTAFSDNNSEPMIVVK
jgi:hypothetical protein